jgi:hypothetical protein
VAVQPGTNPDSPATSQPSRGHSTTAQRQHRRHDLLLGYPASGNPVAHPDNRRREPTPVVLSGPLAPKQTSLVHDTASLRAERRRSFPGRNWSWHHLVGFLSPGYAPQAQAAGYELLGEPDGVRAEASDHDVLSCAGTLFSIEDGGPRHRFVVDPRLRSCSPTIRR